VFLLESFWTLILAKTRELLKLEYQDYYYQDLLELHLLDGLWESSSFHRQVLLLRVTTWAVRRQVSQAFHHSLAMVLLVP